MANESKMDVELLNIIKYTTKDGRNRCILKFRPISDNCVSISDKFKGVSIIETYFDGHEVFDKIPNNYFGSNVEMTLKQVTSSSNPLQQRTIVSKINDINLV